jgi:hypothetical protein
MTKLWVGSIDLNYLVKNKKTLFLKGVFLYLAALHRILTMAHIDGLALLFALVLCRDFAFLVHSGNTIA